MGKILTKSSSERDRINALLALDVPSYRRAYSDRTAFLMACASELAYLRFNPLFSNVAQKEFFLEKVDKLLNQGKQRAVSKLVDMFAYDPTEEKQKLENELKLLQMELIETYDSNGTQAILVSFRQHLVLAFRGTESTSIKDIKADAKAVKTACESGGKVHSGFKEAYEEVALDIEETLSQEEYAEIPLFITGHSLGGALATIAAKRLTHRGGLAACYTFGSPRVGDEKWIASIKTPIYRVVNAADCVTMLPPSSDTMAFVCWISQFIPTFGQQIRSYLMTKFGGYLHCGHMRYMSNCPTGDYANVMLLYSVSIFRRVKGFFIKKLPWQHFLSDHFMTTYRKKLGVIAAKRNLD